LIFSWLIYSPVDLNVLRVVDLGLSNTALTILNVVGWMVLWRSPLAIQVQTFIQTISG